MIKDGGLIRESSSNFMPTFYPRTVFRLPRTFPEGALSCHWPTDDCIVYYRPGGITGYNFVVYYVYALVPRWTVHAEIDN